MKKRYNTIDKNIKSLFFESEYILERERGIDWGRERETERGNQRENEVEKRKASYL